jgi:amino acid transporter
MMVLSVDDIREHSSDMLAVVARKLGGSAFMRVVCVDAVLILCGATLTSIIGVSNLMIRLAKDKVLPSSVAYISRTGSALVAIIVFCVGSISLFLAIFDPKSPTAIVEFGTVYSMAFLSVLSAFAFAAVLLKLYRGNMARMVITKWWHVFFSFICVFVGLIGEYLFLRNVLFLFCLRLF